MMFEKTCVNLYRIHILVKTASECKWSDMRYNYQWSSIVRFRVVRHCIHKKFNNTELLVYWWDELKLFTWKVERFIICIEMLETRKIFSNWVISELNVLNWIFVGNTTQRNIKTNKWAIKCTRYFIQPWWKHNAFYFTAHVRIRKYLCMWKYNSKSFEYSM